MQNLFILTAFLLITIALSISVCTVISDIISDKVSSEPKTFITI